MESFRAASLVLGVATARATHNNVFAGFADPVADLMPMVAGEYVAVHSRQTSNRSTQA
jgi:hypothetical protein